LLISWFTWLKKKAKIETAVGVGTSESNSNSCLNLRLFLAYLISNPHDPTKLHHMLHFHQPGFASLPSKDNFGRSVLTRTFYLSKQASSHKTLHTFLILAVAQKYCYLNNNMDQFIQKISNV